MSKTERLQADEITVGKELPWTVYDIAGKLLLKKGMVIQTAKQMNLLLTRGLYKNANDDDARQPAQSSDKANPFRELADLSARLKLALVTVLKQGEDAEKQITRIARDIQSLSASHPDALIGAIHIDHDHDYVTRHPLHVAILCEIFCVYLSIDAERRCDIICAALTANISVVKLQSTLHTQSAPLSESQKKEMELHPLRSVELLDAAGVTNTVWLSAIEQHHERSNGRGYPHGLRVEKIFREAKIIALCDIYAAMVVDKCYRAAHPASDILRVLFINKGKEHDEELCLQLIKIMGVFPPGSFVKLDNDEIAIVIKRAVDDELWPHVASIIDSQGAPYPNPLPRDCNTEGYRIKEMCSLDKSIPLSLHALWGHDDP